MGTQAHTVKTELEDAWGDFHKLPAIAFVALSFAQFQLRVNVWDHKVFPQPKFTFVILKLDSTK